MTTFRIRHETHYIYKSPAAESHDVAHLVPRQTPSQELLARTLVIRPEPSTLYEHQDFHGNTFIYFAHEAAHSELEVILESDVRVTDPAIAGPAPDQTATVGQYPFWIGSGTGPEAVLARTLTLRSPFVPGLAEARDYAALSLRSDRPLVEAVLELNSRIHADFAFNAEATEVETPLSEVFAHRSGVCQDFAHVALACLRSFGIAARYVSGYVETQPPPGCVKLVGADASHAWVSVYLPAFGGGPGIWLDLDPTNDIMPTDRHVTLAWGRDYGDVAPLHGVVLGGGGHSLTLGVNMERLEP